jgi:hypothetical protein
MAMTSLVAVRIGARSDAWLALGFEIVDGRLPMANGTLVFVEGVTSGIASLVVDGGLQADVDGLSLEAGSRPAGEGGTADELDHVVVMTDSLERTSAAIESSLGLECRRIRETGQVRQAFHRFEDPADGASRGCILEIVENQRVPTPQFWGLVITVDDLDGLCDAHPELISPPTPAVQPGRRIATAGREAGLGTAVAFMTR